MEILLSINVVNDADLAQYPSCLVLMSDWKQTYSFPGIGCFWHFIGGVLLFFHCSVSDIKSTLDLGAMSLRFFLMGDAE